LRDVLLTIAEAGICQVRWSADVLDETERNLAARVKAKSERQAREGAQYLRRIMEGAFPDAMVDRAAYERLIPAMANDEGDRHVLAAAVACRADVLVTANTRHFPEAACAPYGVDVQDPDTFLLHQFELSPDTLLARLGALAKERRHPMDSVEGILQALRPTAPRFAASALRRWEARSSQEGTFGSRRVPNG
jgi:predicted nucleic acid-binding protein